MSKSLPKGAEIQLPASRINPRQVGDQVDIADFETGHIVNVGTVTKLVTVAGVIVAIIVKIIA